MWKVVLSSKAKKQSKIALRSAYRETIENLMRIIADNPFQNPKCAFFTKTDQNYPLNKYNRTLLAKPYSFCPSKISVMARIVSNW
jgi:mRNA-degrading endonuclease RelE of RelBE toxin-antitoxin system